MFYQQCKVFAESGGKLREYNLTPPLWMFLGRTVTGQKTGANNQTKSDVVSIVRFLAWVLNNRGGGVKKELSGLCAGNRNCWMKTASIYLPSGWCKSATRRMKFTPVFARKFLTGAGNCKLRS